MSEFHGGANLPISEGQLAEIDAYLADESKVLDGYQPHWVYASGYDNYQIVWNISEEKTGRLRGHLRFRVPAVDFSHPSISLIVSGQMVSRLDKTDAEKCEPNPTSAARLGLPAVVCGSHIHSWADNRQIVASTGKWELPVRRPVNEELKGLDGMFFWFCGEIRVRIQPHNTPITLPPAGLFGRGQ